MREIQTATIIETVKELCIDANCNLRCDTVQAFKKAEKKEPSPLGREVLKQLIRNSEISTAEQLPFCQDTGYAVLFIDIGQDVKITGGSLTEALNEGVRQGHCKGFLRMSILDNPLSRKNPGDNTPASIHYNIVSGDEFKIALLVKGCGCDNVSALQMFKPSEGWEAAKKFIVQTVENAGPNASPPMTLGIGLGGPFAHAAYLAQKSLLWSLDKPNPDPQLRKLEAELVESINCLGIGPAGFGGETTCLGVHIEMGPAHIAAFPVAVNIDCHSHRGKEATL